jgi:diacylglycerol kinase family enzyme
MLANTGIPLLPFPAGTSNLLAANIMSPSEPHAIVKVARAMRTLDFDLGEISLPTGEHFGFTLMAGAGWDAQIMKDAQAGKKLLGPVAYFTSAFANPTPQVADFTLTIDGREVKSKGVGILIINFSKIQFDLSIVHENKPRDGMLDVVVLSTKDAFGLIPVLFAAIRDVSGDYPTRTNAFEIYSGREVIVDAEPALCMQYDGEVTEHTTPFKATILPEAVRYIVSEECIEAHS